MEPNELVGSKEEVVKKIEVPVGFKTKHGSKYEYFADGSGYVERIKSDRSNHITRGITAFVSQQTADDASRMYAEMSHLPKERQRTYRLMEDKGDHGDYIWEASQVENPKGLLLVMIDGNNIVKGKYKAQLVPEIGLHPFQQSLKNNAPNVHLGHEIIEIDNSSNVGIKLSIKNEQT